VQAFQTELRARYSTMPGLESSVWHGIRFGKELVGKKFSSPEKFLQVQAFQTELRARYSTMPGLESPFWRGIRLQRRRWEGKKLGPDFF